MNTPTGPTTSLISNTNIFFTPHRQHYHHLYKNNKPLILTSLIISLLSLSIIISALISLRITFPPNNDPLSRPFCRATLSRLHSLSTSDHSSSGAFYLTDQETVDFFFTAAFLPSSFLFIASFVYLVAGILVAYSAPRRHGCLKVVENNFCASRRGGVRCLSIINMVFAIIFGVLAIVLGSSLLALGSSCSVPLFWCYEVMSWGLVILYGSTSVSLRQKAAIILGEGNGRDFGLQMLEANSWDVTPDVERRVNEGFKTWMGSSLLSSDEEDEPDDYQEVPVVVQAD